jgi:hypothetical protein
VSTKHEWNPSMLKVRKIRNNFFKLRFLPITNCRLVFWKKVKTPKMHFEINWPLVPYEWLQWIFNFRKFLGTVKNFLKSKIFLKSDILKQWNMQVLVGYQTPDWTILLHCIIALLCLFRIINHENKQCFLNIGYLF